MTFEIPLFPLHTVLFPGTPLYLHIFEERYKMMIQNCLEMDRRFGIVLIRHGQEVADDQAELHPIGCTARIIHIEPLGEGRMNIVALGEQRFFIMKVKHDQPYFSGEVEFLNLERVQNETIERNIEEMTSQVNEYLKLVNQVKPGSLDMSRLRLPEDPIALAYLSASLLQIPPLEKQPFLAATNDSELIDLVQRLYRRETTVNRQLLGVSQQEALHSARMN
jgi:uncharacterized protein